MSPTTVWSPRYREHLQWDWNTLHHHLVDLHGQDFDAIRRLGLERGSGVTVRRRLAEQLHDELHLNETQTQATEAAK